MIITEINKLKDKWEVSIVDGKIINYGLRKDLYACIKLVLQYCKDKSYKLTITSENTQNI